MVLNFLKLASLRGLVIALFLMFSFTVHSSTLWKEGWTNSTHPTPELACDKDFQQWSLYNSGTASSLHVEAEYKDANTYWCRYKWNSSGSTYQSSSVNKVSGACPSGWEDDGSGQCVIAPSCPEGQFMNNGQCESYCPTLTTEGEAVSETFIVSMGSIPSIVESGVCGYSISTVLGCYDILEPKCFVTYSANGQYNASPSSPVDKYYGDVNVDASVQYIPSTSTTVNTPPDVVTDPDGTVQTSESSTTTKTSKGTGQITKDDNNVTLNKKSGSTLVKTRVETTLSYPDGSSQVSKETQNTYTPPEYTTLNQPTSGAESSNTTTQGPSVTYGDTITNYYNSSGQLTASESTATEGNPDGAPEVDETGAEVYVLPSGEGSFDSAMTEVGTEIAQAKADLLSTFNGIKSEASQLVSFNAGSGSGALPCPPPIDISPFGTFDLCFQSYETELSIVGTIIIFIAYFLALAIILR